MGVGAGDALNGGPGDDVIQRGGGRDRALMNAGADTVWDGGGADIFVFGHAGSGSVQVRYFANGIDRLSVDPIALLFAPDADNLDPAQLSVGAANGDLPQFVLTYIPAIDKTVPAWDPDGDDPVIPAADVALLRGKST